MREVKFGENPSKKQDMKFDFYSCFTPSQNYVSRYLGFNNAFFSFRTLISRSLISKSLRKTLPKIFSDLFALSLASHTFNTRWANKCMNTPSHHTKYYGWYAITINVIYIWNFLQIQYQGTLYFRDQAIERFYYKLLFS